MTARVARSPLGEERGVTLTEMMVVLVILGLVLAGMTTLFISASTSHADQSKRVEAQQNGRLALDGLRREIHCASAVTLTSPSNLTLTLPGYCQTPPVASSAPFTWCAVGATPTWALWRYSGSVCSGTGRKMADQLVSSSASLSLFTYNRATPGPVQILSSPAANASVTGGAFKPGTYTYDVTAVLASGLEVSGAPKSLTIATGTPSQITVTWAAVAGAVEYRVYGRESATAIGLRRLATVSSGTVTYVDNYSVSVDGTLKSPPLGTVGVSLVVDGSPADGRQRFTLSDDIVLRNSGRR